MNNEQHQEKKTLRELKKTTDPLFIKQCAGRDPSVRVRLVAIKKIEDPTLLCELAIRIDHSEIRRAVVARLPVQYLETLSEQTESEILSFMCMEQLGNLGQSKMQEIMIKRNPKKTAMWIGAISDPELLVRLYQEGVAKSRIYSHMKEHFADRVTLEMKLNESFDLKEVLVAIEGIKDQLVLEQRRGKQHLNSTAESKVSEAISSRLNNLTIR